jgi:hypothetical protein
VTAIPRDYHNQKGRCCAYTVVGELPAEEVKDILRGRRVVRSFAEFKIGDEVVSGDDELLNSPVEVGDFELEEEDDIETPVDEEDVTPIVSPPRAAKPKAEKKKKGKKVKNFEHKGLRFTAKKILKLVADHGQRGASRITGVPRTTIQTWIAAING